MGFISKLCSRFPFQSFLLLSAYVQLKGYIFKSRKGFPLQSGLFEKQIEYLPPMKKTIFFILLVTFLSCKKEVSKEKTVVAKSSVALGKELFEEKGNCVACHQPEQKIIGPSIQEIAKIYKEKNASIVSFLKEESKPIVDPSQYEVMKTNFAITKLMSDEELKALEEYIYSFSK